MFTHMKSILPSLTCALCLLSLIRAYTELPHSSLFRLDGLGIGDRLSLDPNDEMNHLKHFNMTRVPGSEGSIYVREYIKSHFAFIEETVGIHWDVEEDVFEERGFNFSNIIATLSPPDTRKPRYLTLSVHYDSKIEPFGFIGAIDSAASCGILLEIAEKVSPSFNAAIDSGDYELDTGLKIIFFDGEEAIKQWTDDDSIYGARNLHAQWQSSGELGSIDLLVLLDLLGAKDTNYVPSYFPQTQDAYAELSEAENRLSQVFPDVIPPGKKFLAPPSYTFQREYFGIIGDDHLPFLRSGVPILHMITSTFPNIWHTIDDDFHHVDIVAIHHWCLMFAVFTFEYLDIPLADA